MAESAPPEIQVYASFPHAVALDADLNVDPSNWHWVHCLTLPVGSLNALQFSQRPYKWIRYAIGVIVGAEGDLSSSPETLNVVDYDAGLPAESALIYYHTSDEERRRMFPVDPDIECTNYTSSVASTRRAEFHNEVAERDGHTCVLASLEEEFCDAVHLLAHSKGDRYIATFTQHRSRGPTGSDIIQDIDSVQNGLLLNKLSHVVLGKNVAFLVTPNFAMNTADLDPTATPAETRCTTHLFRPDKPFSLGDGTLPVNSPLRMSDTPTWPPAILFDAVYAGAVLHHFGTQTLKDKIAMTWKATFYPGGVMTTADADYKVITNERADAEKRRQNQTEDRQACHEARGGLDTFDMLMTLPYVLVPQNKMKVMFKEAEERAEETEKRHVQEKVDTWMKQVTAT